LDRYSVGISGSTIDSPLGYNGLSLNAAGVLLFLEVFVVPGVLKVDDEGADVSPANLIFSFENLTLSTCGTLEDEAFIVDVVEAEEDACT
jgi:hypothetical protein